MYLCHSIQPYLFDTSSGNSKTISRGFYGCPGNGYDFFGLESHSEQQ